MQAGRQSQAKERRSVGRVLSSSTFIPWLPHALTLAATPLPSVASIVPSVVVVRCLLELSVATDGGRTDGQTNERMENVIII